MLGGLKTELRTTNPQIFQKGIEGKTGGFQGREEFLKQNTKGTNYKEKEELIGRH